MHIEWEAPSGLVRKLVPFAAVCLIGAALYWWMSAPSTTAVLPSVAVASTVEGSATGVVLVDVVGSVHRPGVVRLASGSRVIDAVAAAGGLLPGHEARINLARALVDGEQLAVGDVVDAGRGPSGSGSAPGGRLNLNAATAAELDGLPGIGAVLAQRIIDYRTKHGPFARLRDLLDVPGIGDAKYANLADSIAVA